MGLIDAYKAMKSIDEIVCSMSVCINSDYCHGMTAMKDAAMHAIEEQPTVDAVPIDFLKQYAEGKRGYYSDFVIEAVEAYKRRTDEQQSQRQGL